MFPPLDFLFRNRPELVVKGIAGFQCKAIQNGSKINCSIDKVQNLGKKEGKYGQS